MENRQDTDHIEINRGEQYVVFKLREEEYAAPILDIQEIIPAGDITPFPNAPAYVSGIINVRGTVATVVSLAKLFSLDRQDNLEEGYIILVKTEKTLLGVLVDTVSSVINISPECLHPAQAMSDIRIDIEYVNAVAVINERVILILNLHHVLNEEEKHELIQNQSVPTLVGA